MGDNLGVIEIILSFLFVGCCRWEIILGDVDGSVTKAREWLSRQMIGS